MARTAMPQLYRRELATGELAHSSTQQFRGEKQNYKPGDKNRAQEQWKSIGEQNVTSSKADEHYREPQHPQFEPQVEGENFLSWMADQKYPIPVGENRPASHPESNPSVTQSRLASAGRG